MLCICSSAPDTACLKSVRCQRFLVINMLPTVKPLYLLQLVNNAKHTVKLGLSKNTKSGEEKKYTKLWTAESKST